MCRLCWFGQHGCMGVEDSYGRWARPPQSGGGGKRQDATADTRGTWAAKSNEQDKTEIKPSHANLLTLFYAIQPTKTIQIHTKH